MIEERTITLTPDNNSMQGVYRRGMHVLVKLDSTNGEFSVTVPNATDARHVIFIFKKISSDSNDITISPVTGENIDGYT